MRSFTKQEQKIMSLKKENIKLEKRISDDVSEIAGLVRDNEELKKTVGLPEHITVLREAFQKDWKKNFDKLQAKHSALEKAINFKDGQIYLLRDKHSALVGRITEENIRQYAAQGYCTLKNSHKELDADLLDDIAKALKTYLEGE